MNEQRDSLQLPADVSIKEGSNAELVEKSKFDIDLGLVAEQFQDQFKYAQEMRREHDLIWDQSWELYNGQYDWTGKEDWQSRLNIPKVRGVVDKATAEFRRALVRMKRFYHIESETKLGTEKGFYTMSLMDYWFDQIDFIEQFSTGLKSGLITSTIIYKIWWEWYTEQQPRWETREVKQAVEQFGINVGEQVLQQRTVVTTPRTRGRLGFKAISPYNFWVGPRNSYRIERAIVDFSHIEKLAKQGIYEEDAVDRVFARSNQEWNAYKEAMRKKEAAAQQFQSKFNKEVELYHFCGDLYDEDGHVIAQNVTYTMAGRDIVLRKPRANPLFHGEDPYVVGTPYIVPFSTYNRGIVEDIAGIANMITELSNLVIDGAQFDAMAAYEIDEDLLSDSRQKKRGVYPGVTFLTKGNENPTNKNVVRPITTGKVPQLTMQVLAFLDREQQLSTNVNNAMRGQDIGADTLGEFQSVMGGAQSALDDAARTVEETVLDDLLWKVGATIYQFHQDYTLPRLMENYPRTTMMLSEMTPEERYATMVGGYSFKARGVSIMLDRSQDLQKIDSFMKLISSIPGVMTRINLDKLLENLVIGIGWNPGSILLDQNSTVMPAGMQAGMPVNPQAAATQTPAQIANGQAGARLGGAVNNPMATAPQGGPMPPRR